MKLPLLVPLMERIFPTKDRDVYTLYGYYFMAVCAGAFLVHHHLIHPSEVICSFCEHETEHDNHLFLHCYHTWMLWQQFQIWFGISRCITNRIDQIIS